MFIKKPLFMQNKDWYYHDKKDWKYKLTKIAPIEAIESYKNFYKNIKEEVKK